MCRGLCPVVLQHFASYPSLRQPVGRVVPRHLAGSIASGLRAALHLHVSQSARQIDRSRCSTRQREWRAAVANKTLFHHLCVTCACPRTHQVLHACSCIQPSPGYPARDLSLQRAADDHSRRRPRATWTQKAGCRTTYGR